MHQEIEIKLAVEPDHAERVWLALARFAHGKSASRELFSAYYDTPDCWLKSNGVVLRLRRDGQRWVQAIKNAGNASGGLHRRAEHETEVAVQLPSFPAMAQAGFGELIANRHTRDALGVAFTTTFSRSSTLIELQGGNIVEVSLDRGSIAAGERREPICEIELELKAGNAAALFELALELARELPVRLDNRSKAQRGYALAAGTKAPSRPSRSTASRTCRPTRPACLPGATRSICTRQGLHCGDCDRRFACSGRQSQAVGSRQLSTS
jgi:triphosphatase